MPPTLRTNAKRIAAGVLTLAAVGAMRLTADPVASQPQEIRERFVFARATLPLPAGAAPVPRRDRPTHPELRHLNSFVTALGAGAALHDLDGNGRADDVCHIDTIGDQVVVSPVPGTGDRYPAFALDHDTGGARELFDRERMMPAGCLPADFDEDGRPDLMVSYLGRTPILFSNRASARPSEGSFDAAAFRPSEILPGGESWSSGSGTVADLDGDGHLEAVFVNWLGNTPAYDPRASAPVEMPDSLSRAFNGGGVRLFRVSGRDRNDGAASFEEIHGALPPSTATGWGLAVAAADLDGDLLPELYIANDFGPDRLLWNRSTPGQVRFTLLEGRKGFMSPKSKVVGLDSFKSMGADFGDVNQDGIPDIYVSSITEPLAVLEGQLVFLSTGSTAEMASGRAPYIEAGEALGLARTGWAWDSKLEDFDNDGVLEAIQATGFIRGGVSRWPELQELTITNDRLLHSPTVWPNLGVADDLSGRNSNPFFVRQGARYVNVAALIGFGEEHVSRGLAFGDVDADGRVDMVVANLHGPSTFYKNEGTRVGGFLGLDLRLPIEHLESTAIHDGMSPVAIATRPAVGASVMVTYPDGTRVNRQVDGGNGHSGKRSPVVHFGLGPAAHAVRVEIRWRDPGGVARSEAHLVTPGWHTIVLGWPGGTGTH